METQKTIGNLLQTRRLVSFQRQRNRREELIKASRLSFQLTESEESAEIIEGGSLEINEEIPTTTINNLKHQKFKPRPKKYKSNYTYSKLAKKLQVPDHLVSIPNDFSQFMLYARPNGKKVIIIFKGNRVTLVNKSGSLVKVFTSNYIVSQQKTILEGIEDEHQHTKIYITDVIQWKGDFKVGEEAEFRYFWLNSNLPKTFVQNQENDYEFILLDIYQATKENFLKLYQQPLQYKKDGLMFVHSKSLYQQTNNSGVLFWKDSNISEYCELKSPLTAIASIRNGCLYSLDDQILAHFSAKQCEQFKQYKQIKFEFTSISIEESQLGEGEIKVNLQGMHCVGLETWAKNIPDTLTKLVFNYRLLTNTPLKAEDIYQALN